MVLTYLVLLGSALLALAIAPCYAAERVERPTLILLARPDPHLESPINLTRHFADDWFPVWSPNGTRIAFVSERDDNEDIYVVDADGGTPVNLTQHPDSDRSPAWSPDGSRIAFVSRRDGNREIYVMAADGESPTNLTQHPSSDESPVWSPDGTKIAFAAWHNGNREVYVVDADGGTPINLTRSPAFDQSPVWSPDGSRIAFYTGRDGNGEIYVMDADGESPTNLTQHPSSDESPVWSPDGTKIAFVSQRDDKGYEEIYVMDADGGRLTNLTQNPFTDEFPAWSPDGSRIAFVSWRDDKGANGEIYVMEADGRNPANLTRNPFPDASPAWSPDGTKIAFVSRRDGNPEIYVAEFIVPTGGPLDTSVPHNFGQQWVDAVAEWPFIVHNPASAADTLRVAAVEVASPYGVSMESFDLAPGGGQQLIVTYAPTQPGFFAQTLVLRSNAPDSPATIQLQGTAVLKVAAMTLSAKVSVHDFGAVVANTQEAWTLKVGNTGRDSLRVAVRTGLPFTAEPTAFAVAQGGVQAVRVLYHPLAAGRHIRPLTLRSNDPDRPQVTISLRGQALDEQPEMRLDPSGSYHFGPQRVGSVTEWTFTVSNAASAADTLRVAAVRVAVPFGVAGGAFKVAPGDSQPVTVLYAPTALGPFEEALVIVSNDPHAPRHELRLQGSTDRGPPSVEVILGTPLQLTQHPSFDASPVWSPDGTRIAFRSDLIVNSDIYAIDADGQNLTNLTHHPAADTSPVWSPDGLRLAFVSDRDGNEDIYAVDADGQNLINLTQSPAMDRSPVWSPDGRRLAFVSEHDDTKAIYAVDADGHNRTKLTPGPAWNDAPAWSPDGRRIAFQAYRYSVWDIYRIDAAGGTLTRLTQRGYNDTPVWSPDGRRLAFVSHYGSIEQEGIGFQHFVSPKDDNGEIYCMDSDGGTLINLTRHPSDDRHPVWSPDGTHIAFVSDRSNGTNIYLVDAYAGLHLTRLPWKAWKAAPAWSPDGRRLAFLADRDGAPQLSVVGVSPPRTSVASASASLTPERFVLHPNAPNPFNPTTLIRYGLPQAAAVEVAIYDMLGQRVVQLVDKVQSGGQYAVVWDGRDGSGRPVASGVYVSRLLARPLGGGLPHSQTRRMVLLR